MDPNANLQEQERIILRNTGGPEFAPEVGDRARLQELRDALYTWMTNGGFVPDWSKAPRAAAHYGR